MATRKQIQTALEKPYDRHLFAKEVLYPVFGQSFKLLESPSKPHVDPTQTEAAVIQSVSIYATIQLDDQTDVSCYEILLQPTVRIEQSKVAIQQYVRKLLLPGQAALINFVSPVNKDMWRFTLVARDSKITDEGIKEVQTHPKRYTYLVEKDRPNRTLAERLEVLSLAPEKNLQTLMDAFSVEKMSKAFFDEYKEHYQNFVEYLTGKRLVKKGSKWEEKQTSSPSPFLKSVFNGDEKKARDFIKKLMGRIVFLYFVQKKRWLGASTTEYKDGPYDFIYQLFKKTGGNDNFFSIGLSPLFFEALNKQRPDDDWETPWGEVVKIPFLNGGLFVRDEIDEIIHRKGDILTFPAKLFSNIEKMEQPVERGFLDFLNAYNFTVYEDSTDDHTVAIDPEMLGHIFENLLEDNKDKGAFYTPKEIVHYMCQESLIEYLVTNLGNDLENSPPEKGGFSEERRSSLQRQRSHEEDTPSLKEEELLRKQIELLVKEKEISNLTKKQLNRINELLDNVKICDPAIGSGAFPMGLLQEIFTVKEAIAYELKQPFEPARVKENIIQNSIYGVDIEKGAVDIARLRFWLSLVVDEEKPRALPNLDYKIVVGNSLVSKFEDEIIEINWEIKPEGLQTNIFGNNEQVLKRQELLYQISQKQKAFFDPKNTADKSKLKQEIRNLKIEILINQLQLMINSTGMKDEPKRANYKKASDFTKAMERFMQTKGWEQTIQKLQAIKADPEKPFNHFDWKLDFPEVLNPIIAGNNPGFDIVIGNPPYIKEYTNRAAFDGFRESKYYQGKMDIWYGFACVSLDLLKTGGIECFIAQNNWITSAGASIFRNKVVDECEIKLFTDFGNYKVFESAGIQTMIYIIQKRIPREAYKIKYSCLTNDSISKQELIQFLNYENKDDNSLKFDFLFKPESVKDKTFTFTNRATTNILEKIENIGELYLTNKEVAQGIVPNPDVINSRNIKLFSKREILENNIKVNDGVFVVRKGMFENLDNVEKKYLKPLYEPKEVSRYKFIDEYEHEIIYITKTNYQNDAPNLLKHLAVYRNIMDRRRENINGRLNYFHLHWPREEYYFKEGGKILSVRKCEKPTFIYTEKPAYVMMSFNIIKTKRVNLKYLTGLLNSKLIEFWLRNKGKMQGNNFQIDKEPLLAIPIYKPSNREQSVIAKIVDKIISLKSKGEDTKDLEQQIDNMVFRLYGLTYEEVKVIDQEFPLSKEEYESIKVE